MSRHLPVGSATLNGTAAVLHPVVNIASRTESEIGFHRLQEGLMALGRIVTRVVVTAARNESVRAIARRMAENNVGTVVVLDDDGREPAGVITDRDIAVRCVADGFDPAMMRAGDLMSRPARTVYEHVPIDQALARMADAGTRRLVVVGEDSRVAGVFCLDDVLGLMAGELESVGRILAAQAPVVDRVAALDAVAGH